MHILIATDAQWVLDEVMAAVSSSSTTFTVVTNGREVVKAVKQQTPDIAILDMQVGTMGAMAITMDLRLDHSGGALPHVPVLMLLDRKADIHLARRSGANGWLIKPLNALRLRKAAQEVAAGGCYAEGLAVDPASVSATNDAAETTIETANIETASADSLSQ